MKEAVLTWLQLPSNFSPLNNQRSFFYLAMRWMFLQPAEDVSQFADLPRLSHRWGGGWWCWAVAWLSPSLGVTGGEFRALVSMISRDMPLSIPSMEAISFLLALHRYGWLAAFRLGFLLALKSGDVLSAQHALILRFSYLPELPTKKS